MLFALFSAISQSVSLLVDKIILSKRHISSKDYLSLGFFFLTFGCLIIYPYFGHVDWGRALELKNLMIFLIIVASAFTWNILYCIAVKRENIGEVELISMTQPIMTIILASLLFSSERTFDGIAIGLIAGVAILYAHRGKYKFNFDKTFLILVLAIFLSSFESVLSKYLLGIYSPLAFYFYRVLVLFVGYIIYNRQNFFRLPVRDQLTVGASAVLGIVYMVLRFAGYEKYGVVYTTTVLLAAPIFVYLLDPIIIKEKIPKKTIYAAIVIILAVVYLQIK